MMRRTGQWNAEIRCPVGSKEGPEGRGGTGLQQDLTAHTHLLGEARQLACA